MLNLLILENYGRKETGRYQIRAISKAYSDVKPLVSLQYRRDSFEAAQENTHGIQTTERQSKKKIMYN